MKYEFKYMVREHQYTHYHTKYRCVVEEKRYNSQKAAYEELAKNHKEENPIILINQLDDNGEFIQIIQ